MDLVELVRSDTAHWVTLSLDGSLHSISGLWDLKLIKCSTLTVGPHHCRRLQNVLNNEKIILVIWILGQCNGQIWQHKTRILVMRIREWSIWFSSATTYHLGGTFSPFWRIWENGPLMTVWVKDECIKKKRAIKRSLPLLIRSATSLHIE